MTYTFLVIADIHWGAMDYRDTYTNLRLFLEFISQMKDRLDFIVIAGDYFDYRLQLNSKTALMSIHWFDELIRTAKRSNVKKVRMLKGTREHDNDQLEVFRSRYEKSDGFFKLYNITESEELLPELRCVFCPDENMNLRSYHNIYYDKFIPNPNIGFFHGNFDTILPSIEFNRIQEKNLSTMIYEYDKFSKVIKGPLISGHWHVKNNYRSLYYTGSFDRWKFNEEEDKGFIYGEIDIETDKYYIHRVTNPLARCYKTLIIDSESCYTPEHFSELYNKISQEVANDQDIMLRISYILSKENDEALINFNLFQKQCASFRQIKIDLKDLMKKTIKKEKRKQVEIEASKYQYIFDSNINNIPEIIHKFIIDNKNVDIPIATIQKYVKKYLEK